MYRLLTGPRPPAPNTAFLLRLPLCWASRLGSSLPHISRALKWKCGIYKNVTLTNAPVNSTCAEHPPRADPRALEFFLPWMANSRGWGLLSCQIPRGGDEKRGQMPRPPSTLQHFSLIAQSNSAILSILMCDFLFQLTSSFVIALGF